MHLDRAPGPPWTTWTGPAVGAWITQIKKGFEIMPIKALRPCKASGCPELTSGRYCPAHGEYEKAVERGYDTRRGSTAERGYGGRWQRAREAHLRHYPLCVNCLRNGRTEPGTVVDHIKPHRGDMKLFWDSSNWQSLCQPCHDSWKQSQEKAGAFYVS